MPETGGAPFLIAFTPPSLSAVCANSSAGKPAGAKYGVAIVDESRAVTGWRCVVADACERRRTRGA